MRNFVVIFLLILCFQKPCFSKQDLLAEVQRKAFRYFIENRHPDTGLIMDRANNFQRSSLDYSDASSAACGFALTIYPLGAEKGWITQEEAKKFCNQMLDTFLNRTPNKNGFFYHFLKMDTAQRAGMSEISSIDTAIFVAGALFAGEYFGGEIKEKADRIYKRIDWQWMLNGKEFLSHGWKPENGFIKYCWNQYSESMILYILAIGSPSHPIHGSCWDKIKRPLGKYGKFCFIVSPPLFTHQYSHIWIDFRNIHDKYANYFENSKMATLANRQFCIDRKEQYKTYGENSWGITACDGPSSYKAYGADEMSNDGTIAPTAALSSFPFTPEESMAALKWMYKNLKEIWGRYGFSDSYNFDVFKKRLWFSTDAIAIDQGALLLMIENYKTNFVWKYFMRNPYIKNGLKKAGFTEGKGKLHIENLYKIMSQVKERPVIEIPYKEHPEKSGNSCAIYLNPENSLESGNPEDKRDFSAKIDFSYNKENLFVEISVCDRDIETFSGENLYRGDCVEIFIDPQNDGLKWGNPGDFQIGLNPAGQTWCWFQKKSGKKIIKIMEKTEEGEGYKINASIPWQFLNIKPHKGLRFGISPAIHSFDGNGKEMKLNWFFKSPGIILGEAILK